MEEEFLDCGMYGVFYPLIDESEALDNCDPPSLISSSYSLRDYFLLGFE